MVPERLMTQGELAASYDGIRQWKIVDTLVTLDRPRYTWMTHGHLMWRIEEAGFFNVRVYGKQWA